MRDYYTEFVTEKKIEISPKPKVSKVPKGGNSRKKEAFDTFGPEQLGNISKNNTVPENNVFESKSGKQAAEFIVKLESEKGLSFYYNSPLQSAYEMEIALVRAIERREAGHISTQELKDACDLWSKFHNGSSNTNNPDAWTGKETQLFTLILYSGRKRSEYCCNALQAQLIEAVMMINEESVTTEIIKL